MKQGFKTGTRQAGLAIILLMLAHGCECDKELTRSEILTGTLWRLSEAACSSIDDEEYCVVKFNSDGSFDESFAALGYTTWALTDNDETLVLDWDAFKIISLSGNELRIRYRDAILACQISFVPASSSSATTTGVSLLSGNSAKLYASVRSTMPVTSVMFEYGTAASYGQSVPVISSFTAGVTPNIINAAVSGLSPGSVYHYRIRASNSSETFYGKDLTFRTFNAETVLDINGNVYNTVTIGSEIWMAENLKVTRFNDGEPIPLVTDGAAWGELSSPAYCWYDNDAVTYKNDYGALYNWYTVSKGGLCPAGWHVPTNQEFIGLTGSLGQNAADKLKEAGQDHWISFDNKGSNESGFSALPGGWRTDYDTFSDSGFTVCMWSSTEDNPLSSWYFRILSNTATTTIMVKEYGCSVRCIKN